MHEYCTDLSVKVLPEGMLAPGEHVVVHTAHREDVHHAGGASVTCTLNLKIQKE